MFKSLFKIEENWVVFSDMFSKNGNGDSIRPIAEELKKQQPDMKFFFCSNSKKGQKLNQIDMADEVIFKGSLRYKYVCSKAKYVVTNMSFPNHGKKRKGQIFIATWHGCGPKKTYLAVDKENKSYIKYAKSFEKVDAFCLQGEVGKDVFKEVFNLKDEVFINSGLPRNDILFSADEEFKKEFKKSLGLPEDKKVILYCPTWRREDYNFKAYLPLNIENLKSKLQDDYVLLLRSHVGKHTWVNSNREVVSIFDNEFCFDGAQGLDITKLYLITDILITDYSSSITDFAITGKPQVLYVYDIEEYSKKVGLFFDMKKDYPFPVAENEDELIDAILNLNIDNEKYDSFKEKHVGYEKGQASKFVVDRMFKLTKN